MEITSLKFPRSRSASSARSASVDMDGVTGFPSIPQFNDDRAAWLKQSIEYIGEPSEPFDISVAFEIAVSLFRLSGNGGEVKIRSTLRAKVRATSGDVRISSAFPLRHTPRLVRYTELPEAMEVIDRLSILPDDKHEYREMFR